jgi:hypothetical protein
MVSGMTTRALAGAVLMCTFALPAAAEQPCRRNLESGFSYCPPEGWTIKQSLEEKFKTFLGPVSNTLTPSINARDEDNEVPLPEHIAAIIKYVLASPEKSGATAITILRQSDFVTASGLHGIKVVFHFENSAKGLTVRTYQYYFSGRGNQKLVLTCTALEADRNTMEPVFDRALKTFQLDK